MERSVIAAQCTSVFQSVICLWSDSFRFFLCLDLFADYSLLQTYLLHVLHPSHKKPNLNK